MKRGLKVPFFALRTHSSILSNSMKRGLKDFPLYSFRTITILSRSMKRGLKVSSSTLFKLSTTPSKLDEKRIESELLDSPGAWMGYEVHSMKRGLKVHHYSFFGYFSANYCSMKRGLKVFFVCLF